MAVSSGIEGVGFKPGELTSGEMLFLQVVFAVGITLPVLLCGYGLITYSLGWQ